MDNLLFNYVEELRQITQIDQYNLCTQRLNQMLLSENYSFDIIQATERKERYTVNKFSDESTRENMMRAKANLILYLESLIYANDDRKSLVMQNCLRNYLQNFYSFLELLRETKPHKKSELDIKVLQQIQIKNEYDLQHLLHAAIKPLCMDARIEVPEDTGYGLVKSDIRIPSLNTVIEAKCTRETLSLKKLTEKIEADIVHYQAEFIYFYIYDKTKIVKDRHSFETVFNRKFDGKNVEVILLQPIHM